jgi:uncharacterized protein
MTGEGDKGIVLRPARFPGRAPIDAYGNGGFRFADMSHRGSLMCLPLAILGWDMANAADFTIDAFAAALDRESGLEVLLIGTGADIVPLKPEIKAAFRERSIMADAMSTGAAVRTFNVLLAEGRAVGAALVAVP